MGTKTIFRLGCVLALALVLGACSNVRKQFGLTKQAPDEFRVVSRAPLTLPPDYNLRPPRPGAEQIPGGSPKQQARQAVFRAPQPKGAAPAAAPTGNGPSIGERAFLKSAGADNVDPGVRILVNRETDKMNQADKDLLQVLVFWREPEPTGVIVDAEAEARRLRENTALGKEATAGETPTIERRKKALLEGIF